MENTNSKGTLEDGRRIIFVNNMILEKDTTNIEAPNQVYLKKNKTEKTKLIHQFETF